MKKPIAVLVAVLLVVGIVIGGTMAWLTSTPDPVKNVFTAGDVKLDLTETDTITDAEGNKTKEFQMIPGCTIKKDPKVTVQAISEPCYVFVEAIKSNNFDTFMEYEIDDSNWEVLDSTKYPGVYYKKIETVTIKDISYGVIKNDTVTVKDTVTKSDMNSLNSTNYPILTFKAYAIQLYKENKVEFKPEDAWVAVPKN